MIRFNCPHCNRLYELPDALARLPLVCKQCGQRITPPEGATVPPPAPPPPKVAPPPFSPIPVPPPKTSAKPQAAPAAPAKEEAKPVASLPPPVPPVAKPQAAPAAPPKPVEPVATKPPVAPPAPSEKDEPSEDDVLVARPDSTPDIDFNIGGPTAQSLSEANRQRPAGLSNADQAKPPDADDEPINLELLPRASAPPPVPWKAPDAQLESAPAEKPPGGVLPLLVDLAVLVLLVGGGILLGEFLARKSMGQILSAPGFLSIDLLVLIGPAGMFALVYLLLNSREKTVGAWLRRRKASAEISNTK